MKKNSVRLYSLISLTWFATLCVAAPSIESRNGQPVFSAMESSGTPGDSMVNQPITRQTISQLESLRQEVSELRGLIEVQSHELKRLEKAQLDLNTDLERRLTQLQQETVQTVSDLKTADLKTADLKHNTKSNPAAQKSEQPDKLSTDKPVKSMTAKAPNAAIDPATQKPETKQSPPTKKAEANHSGNLSVSKANSEEEAYQISFNYVRTKQYSEAISAFHTFLKRFPGGEHTPEVHYWLGEVYRVQWQGSQDAALLDKANLEFSSVTAQYPDHPKAADAMLKLGFIDYDKGDVESARRYWGDVKKRYPGTAAARIADTRLNRAN